MTKFLGRKLIAFLSILVAFVFCFLVAIRCSTPEVIMALITFIGGPVAGMGAVLVAGQSMVDHMTAKKGNDAPTDPGPSV